MKKSVPIKPFWYSDVIVLPKLVTIITTLNKQGIINAAPYSLFSPYDVMTNQPQIMVGMRKFSHTYKNILATGEFVVSRRLTIIICSSSRLLKNSHLIHGSKGRGF